MGVRVRVRSRRTGLGVHRVYSTRRKGAKHGAVFTKRKADGSGDGSQSRTACAKGN